MSLTPESIRKHEEKERAARLETEAREARECAAYEAWVRPVFTQYVRDEISKRIGCAKARGETSASLRMNLYHVDERIPWFSGIKSRHRKDDSATHIEREVCLEVVAECAAIGIRSACEEAYGGRTTLVVNSELPPKQ